MKESSEVLARKYRPVNFDELIGQEAVSQTLSLALDSNRLSHAYLFSGLRGSGKTSTARIFSKALICEKGITQKPCQTCQNCIMALENRHMDIVEMDAASNRGIDDIRELIEQTKYRPATARFKIFIIDEVHMLTPQAFNALLKTLEEPPPYVKFILATTDPLKLPATILSRTQHFRFKSIAQNKITDHLAHILNLEGIKYESGALEILARSGSGSLRDTLTLLDQAIIYSKNHVDIQTVTDMLGLVDPKFIDELFSAVFAKDYAALVEFTKTLQDYEAEMVVDELIAYLKYKMYAGDALYSTLVLDRFFRILSDSKYLFSINADGSFVLSLIFFKMVEALRIKEIDQMIESLQKEIHKPSAPYTMPMPMPMQESVTKQEEKEKDLHVEINPYTKIFQKLIANIKDRNFELGRCFEQSIYFISYENSTLTWESCADDECKKILTHGYSAIKQLAKEAFGIDTKIKHEPCTKSVEESQEYSNTEQTATFTPSTSMIEDAEIGGSASCVANCNTVDSSKEINGADILDEPMIQKATELFEAKKITIQSKI
ncbi:MAG: DNA polymerase III subunit gamma/tau [Sulfurimonas sp. RIFOXYD12_FULL_33_39]|uniref:DNA polymerase III subunit gamma/tau n=1 Tax=unclassified Sulfurimonas TaxID=2623549 RepID=UPI0008CA9C44|nr:MULTISPECIES: DNA polymerase III subunit gamma/tau [unclassified Sulfurimonas]OHE06013.1 MAG: DNA polymerase III subunit gamma/tau [Sulfurimonas sp. RIFCSPLOWO2_12_FULL_34_6]OHE08680.1 MAG: DNA polymerase III subunit gamma/tau [Sulfurimonas sp. RIFOXYD12_FULL_33_39]OHE13965.1 MAG: DNA polymerase III subunit gamma/tau [Sulfurimonas sp. RIFOXYD2_FULL_34_21]DAB28445.1 MAG TPA: DNA polymerase III subunit gamma/tau [Sulfurimonas sp. UBA10385]